MTKKLAPLLAFYWVLGGILSAQAAENAAATEEISFKKSLRFQELAMSVDEKAFVTLKCSKQTDKPATVGSLDLDGSTKAAIICADDYLGSVQLQVKLPVGSPVELSLSGSSGDAGDRGETRSWVEHEGKVLRIRSLSYYSSEDVMGEAAVECSNSFREYRWNEAKGQFTKKTLPLDKKYSYKAAVHEKCR